jgi:ATP-binding protein involved in chromosome partitioning
VTGEAPVRPLRVTPFPSGELAVAWEDGHQSFYDGHVLRCACACASCVDEMSGRKVLVDDGVPRDVKPMQVLPVGRYGISIVWSDGHDTGIYTFERLRTLCPCCQG